MKQRRRGCAASRRVLAPAHIKRPHLGLGTGVGLPSQLRALPVAPRAPLALRAPAAACHPPNPTLLTDQSTDKGVEHLRAAGKVDSQSGAQAAYVLGMAYMAGDKVK